MGRPASSNIARVKLHQLTSGAPLDYLIWGVSLAGLVQFILVFGAARRAGLKVPLSRPRIAPDTRRFFALVVPGILAAGIGQINLLIGTSIATGQAGAAAWLYYADRLYQLPMGVVGVALAVALLPDLTRRIARADLAGARSSQDLAVTLAMLLTLPAAFGLYVLAEPTVNVLFERGPLRRLTRPPLRPDCVFLLWPAGVCFGARPAAVIFCPTRHAQPDD